MAKKIPTYIYNNISIILTFIFFTFSLIVFRTTTYAAASNIVNIIASGPGKLFIDSPSTIAFIVAGVAILLLSDIQEEFGLIKLNLFVNYKWMVQLVNYALLLVYIIVAGVFDGGQFIYFAF